MDEELEEKISSIEKKKKKKLRKQREKMKKLQHKIDMKMVLPGDQIEIQAGQNYNLFKLSDIRDKQAFVNPKKKKKKLLFTIF